MLMGILGALLAHAEPVEIWAGGFTAGAEVRGSGG